MTCYLSLIPRVPLPLCLSCEFHPSDSFPEFLCVWKSCLSSPAALYYTNQKVPWAGEMKQRLTFIQHSRIFRAVTQRIKNKKQTKNNNVILKSE